LKPDQPVAIAMWLEVVTAGVALGTPLQKGGDL